MNTSTIYSLKRRTILFSTLLVTLLFLSATTAVPQAQGKVVNDQLDRIETIRSYTTLIESISSIDTETQSKSYCLLLIGISDRLIDAIAHPEQLQDTQLEDLIPECPADEAITNELLVEKTEQTILSLQQTLDDLDESDSTPDEAKLSIPFWQTLISWLLKLLKNKLTGDNDGGIPDGGNAGFFETLLSILSALMVIPMMILKLLVKGLVGVIGGIIKILGSIVIIFLLFLAGIQTSLTLGAFFFIFLGFMSKIGIQAFSIIGAPIFALIAAQISVSTGSLLGGLSMALFSILSIIILFALPIAIIGILILVIGGLPDDIGDFDFNFTPDGTGLLYMILSMIASFFKTSTA
ncbi:MAG: hypothetical protein V1769_05145 [Thermoplasmatota archaeon]